MRVTVIGTGYVGLVTAACLARLGHRVTGADVDRGKIATLKAGGLTIWEPGLEELLREGREQGTLDFTTDIDGAAAEADVHVIAVGTPSLPDGRADLSQVRGAVDQAALHGPPHSLILLKSTVPVGTSDGLAEALRRRRRFMQLVHCPEFLRQGTAVSDFMHPDRIVIGSRSVAAGKVAEGLFGGIDAPVLTCDPRSAELIKYACNAFLAIKISYINMIARYSERTGADVEAVARGMGADRRIGPDHLRPGAGYGGSCFPKDTRALLAMGEEAGCPMPLVEAAARINDGRPRDLTDRMKEALSGLEGKRIALLGLTFKPLSDDLREAPSLAVSRLLLEEGAKVHAYDPLVRRFPVAGVALRRSLAEAVQEADGAMILTGWEEFREADWIRLSAEMARPVIVDGRNLFSLEEMAKMARQTPLVYLSTGRPSVSSESVGVQ